VSNYRVLRRLAWRTVEPGAVTPSVTVPPRSAAAAWMVRHGSRTT